MKNIKKILALLTAIGGLLLGNIAYAQVSGVGGQTLWKMLSGSLQPVVSSWTIGSSANRVAKIWATDIDSTSISLAGVSGDLDMGGNDITNIGIASSTSLVTGTISVPDYLSFSGTYPNINFLSGYQSGLNLDIGATDNFYFGYQAGMSSSTATSILANNNIGIGKSVLSVNALGNNNIALGSTALQNNENGSHNVAIGSGALKASTYTSTNIAIGRSSMQSANGGSGNIGIGYYALLKATGTNNIALGQDSLRNNVSHYNIALGQYALKNSTSAQSNVAIGTQAMQLRVSGNFNTAIGDNALRSNTEGSYNTIIGLNSFYSNLVGSDNVGLGAYSGRYETASSTFYLNNRDLTDIAGDKAYSLLYGTFGTGSSTVGQTLTVNAASTTIKNVATSTLIVDTSSASQGSCLKLKDFDGGGYTYVTVLDGVLTASADSCE